MPACTPHPSGARATLEEVPSSVRAGAASRSAPEADGDVLNGFVSGARSRQPWGEYHERHDRCPRTSKKAKEQGRAKTKKQPPYHVVLLNDDDHSYAYVIRMLRAVVRPSARRRASRWPRKWTPPGRVIVDTTSKERAELKRDQIHAFGADPRIPRCKGSMSAVIEPAEG